MKQLILAIVLLGVLADRVCAGVNLGTSNPPGTPLTMRAGTTSGPILVHIITDTPVQDLMAAWNVELEIISNAGTTGTLKFQDPATGTPPNPSNNIFDGNGLGIAAADDGSYLSANDFLDPTVGLGMPVPGAPGANLLQ